MIILHCVMLDLIKEIILEFIIYGIPTMLVCFPLSGIQFLKIHKQNYDTETYTSIIKNYYNKYGFKIFFRGLIPYTAMNGVSSGIYPIAVHLYLLISSTNIFMGALTLAVIAALIETSVTIKLESREILRNKIISSTKMTVFNIFIPIYFRNFIYWLPACLCDELLKRYDLSLNQVTLLSIATGFLAGLLSLTIDVYATRKFGEDERKYNIPKFIHDIKTIGMQKLFSGALCRGVQIAIFTIATSVSNYIKPLILGIFG